MKRGREIIFPPLGGDVNPEKEKRRQEVKGLFFHEGRWPEKGYTYTKREHPHRQ